MDINALISSAFAPLFGLIMLVVLILNIKNIDKRIKIVFLFLALIELIELTCYNVELVTASWDKPTNLRIFLSAIGYAIRPFIIYLIILINMRFSTKNIYKYLLLIPAIIGTIIAFSAFFTDIAYSYDSLNEFHRGPLGFFSQIIIVIYLLICIVLSVISQIKYHKEEDDYLEIATLSIGAIFIISAMVLEAVYSVRSIGRSAVVYSTLFYFIYFINVQYKIKVNKTKSLIGIDSLTGLYNKLGFAERANASLMITSDSYDAVLFADIDNFKTVNDTYGHLVGDEILIGVTEDLKASFKEYGFIGRFGGDEFYIYLENINKDLVNEAIDKLHDSLSRKKFGSENNVDITISIGAITFNKSQVHDFSTLISKADKLLYKAKKKKGNSFSIIVED